MNEHSKKKDKVFGFVLILAGILIVAGFSVFKLYQQKEKSKEALPYLLQGESIGYFELIGMDAAMKGRGELKSDKPVLIFVFSRPCSPCNKNIPYWKKIAGLLKGQAMIYGIVLSDINEAVNFSEKARLNFPVFVPQDLEKFKKALRIKLNFPQTIIYHEDQVRYMKFGLLEGEDAAGIINRTRDLI